MKNKDRIRNMTDEELTDFITKDVSMLFCRDVDDRCLTMAIEDLDQCCRLCAEKWLDAESEGGTVYEEKQNQV